MRIARILSRFLVLRGHPLAERRAVGPEGGSRGEADQLKGDAVARVCGTSHKCHRDSRRTGRVLGLRVATTLRSDVATTFP